MLFQLNDFDNLCNLVQKCTICPRMCDSQRVLNRSAGALDAPIMFIGEAPGRLGADNSGIPFHGDKAGHNFEELLDFAGIDRSNIFVTNAVLCNPKDENGNNSPPSKIEIKNCAQHLQKQIEIINPKIIITLGSVALEATRHIFEHSLSLKESVRTANAWFDRILIPLYHPGQRAMMHRSFANQRSDYQFVSEQLKRASKPFAIKGSSNKINYSTLPIVKNILTKIGVVDYFALHKLYYLVEYYYYKEFDKRLTNAYIVRQKDGPYCTDLHILKLKKGIPEILIKQKLGRLNLSYQHSLFDGEESLMSDAENIIEFVVNKYGSLSNEKIKTAVYLTTPMRTLLRQEKDEHLNLYNIPIPFESASKLQPRY